MSGGVLGMRRRATRGGVLVGASIGVASGLGSLTQAAAATLLSFGPSVGGGLTSGEGLVRHASGFEASVQHSWDVAEGMSLGPRAEFVNQHVAMRLPSEAGQAMRTYDNRLFGLGVIGHWRQGAWVLGGHVGGGAGVSKLFIDTNAPSTYIQTNYNNLSGAYAHYGLVGTYFVREGIGLRLGFSGLRYGVDQAAAAGTFSGERSEGDQLLQLRGAVEPGSLEERREMTTLSFRFGLQVGF